MYAAPQSALVFKVGEQFFRDPDGIVVAVADEDIVQGVAVILAGLALSRLQKPLFALLSDHVDVVADQKPAKNVCRNNILSFKSKVYIRLNKD